MANEFSKQLYPGQNFRNEIFHNPHLDQQLNFILGSQARASAGIPPGPDPNRQATQFHTDQGGQDHKTGSRTDYSEPEFTSEGVATFKQHHTSPYS